MSNIAPVQYLTPVEGFVAEVLPESRLEELRRSLPAHIKPAMFQRSLLNAVMINPDLMSYNPGLVFREVSKAAALGLFLDPQLGEAYIVETYNYKTKNKEPQLRIGYRGMYKLARQSGDVSLIYAHEVHQHDEIEADLGVEKTLVHKPKLFTDRGPVIGYYAVIKYRDGAFDFEPMSLAQVDAIRDRTDAYKAFKEGKIKSTPWATDHDEMSKKTTIKRLIKRAPQSPELSEAVRIEDEAEGIVETRRPSLPLVRPPNPHAPRLVAPAPEAIKEIEGSATNLDKGEAAPPTQRPPAPSMPSASGTGQALRRSAVDSYREAAAFAKTVEELDAAWSKHIAPIENEIGQEMYEFAAKIDDERRGQLE